MGKRVHAPPAVTVDGPSIEEEMSEISTVSKKPKHVRVATSSFHITVNTNQRYGSESAIKADLKPLYYAMKGVFGDPATVESIIEIMNKGDTFRGSVGSVNSEIGVEYSEKAGLHAHCLLTIAHRTKVRIHLKNLRRALDEHLPHLAKKAPHTFVRFVPDQKQTVKNYIYKTMGDETLKMREGVTYEVTDGAPSCKCECKIGDMSSFFSG